MVGLSSSLFRSRFSFCFVCVCVCVRMLNRLSCVQLFVILWAVDRHVLLFVGLSRQEYWSGLPCPPPGDLPDPGIKPATHVSRIGRQVLYH